jgi:2-amino-4-hydroxy-6-hydroxymethyldihydropteridine diphosphokinase
MRQVLLGLGGNQPGTWGTPAETLRRCLVELAGADIVPVAVSHLYQTVPMGGPAQPAFLNAVASVCSALPPAGLLRVLKHLERRAGRRAAQRWGPRPLDIDVIADGGRINGWVNLKPDHSANRGLVVPHPRLHQRAFVLVPLLDVAPRWRHPVLDRLARTLLLDLGPQRETVRLANEHWPRGSRVQSSPNLPRYKKAVFSGSPPSV